MKLLEATMDTNWGIGVRINHCVNYDVDNFSVDDFPSQNALGVILQELRTVLQTYTSGEWQQKFLG